MMVPLPGAPGGLYLLGWSPGMLHGHTVGGQQELRASDFVKMDKKIRFLRSDDTAENSCLPPASSSCIHPTNLSRVLPGYQVLGRLNPANLEIASKLGRGLKTFKKQPTRE